MLAEEPDGGGGVRLVPPRLVPIGAQSESDLQAEADFRMAMGAPPMSVEEVLEASGLKSGDPRLTQCTHSPLHVHGMCTRRY